MNHPRADKNCPYGCNGTGKCSTCKGDGEYPKGAICHDCAGGGLCKCVVRNFERSVAPEKLGNIALQYITGIRPSP